MRIEDRKRILCENLRLFNKSIYWLEKSLDKVSKLNNLKNPTEEDYETIEALMNRYSRAVDILINRVLRSLDLVELEETSRKLDIVIRAEKRGFIEDYNTLIEMKDLRNELAHEYLEERLVDRLEEVILKGRELLDIAVKVNNYVKKHGYCFNEEAADTF